MQREGPQRENSTLLESSVTPRSPVCDCSLHSMRSSLAALSSRAGSTGEEKVGEGGKIDVDSLTRSHHFTQSSEGVSQRKHIYIYIYIPRTYTNTNYSGYGNGKLVHKSLTGQK